MNLPLSDRLNPDSETAFPIRKEPTRYHGLPLRSETFPTPRTGNATRHDLLEILTIALTASICGVENCCDFADFAMDRRSLFQEFLRLENGPPGHDTFSRVFRLLDPTAFATCLGRFLEGLSVASEGVVAIDGRRCAARSTPRRVAIRWLS